MDLWITFVLLPVFYRFKPFFDVNSPDLTVDLVDNFRLFCGLFCVYNCGQVYSLSVNLVLKVDNFSMILHIIQFLQVIHKSYTHCG